MKSSEAQTKDSSATSRTGSDASAHAAEPAAMPSPAHSPLAILLPYQLAWVQDDTRFKIGLWSRQVGKSFACACEAVRDSLLHPCSTWIILSAGERQALEFMEKARMWARAFQFYTAAHAGDPEAAAAREKAAELRFANGSRILALPANPNTARGYSANLILDEFAFHENPDAIWRGIYPSISNPLKGRYKLRIVSTPNGKANKFHELWTRHTRPHGDYSGHLITIHDAAAAGLPIDIPQLRTAIGDPEGWAQEFECQFLDGSSVLLSYELIAACENEEATTGAVLSPSRTTRFYAGIDIGRRKDFTVLWILEGLGSTLWTRRVQVLENMPFGQQLELLRHQINTLRIQRTCIDATGIGAMLAEELASSLGESRVEQCRFTSELKADLFTGLRRAFDDKALRIPAQRDIREDLHSIRRTLSPHGNVRYTAPHTPDGHADRATALALALRASATAQGPFRFQSTNTRAERNTSPVIRRNQRVSI